MTRSARSVSPSFRVRRKRAPSGVDRGDTARIDLRHGPALEPLGVGDEVLDRQPPRQRHAAAPARSDPGSGALRVGDVRAPPFRAQQHALRHVVAPEAHDLAEHLGLDLGGAQMSGNGEPVWAGADDRHLPAGPVRSTRTCRTRLGGPGRPPGCLAGSNAAPISRRLTVPSVMMLSPSGSLRLISLPDRRRSARTTDSWLRSPLRASAMSAFGLPRTEGSHRCAQVSSRPTSDSASLTARDIAGSIRHLSMV